MSTHPQEPIALAPMAGAAMNAKATESTALAAQSEATVISRYQVLVDDVVQAEKDNATAAFNYRDRKGNKDARSHCHKLRSLKGKIDSARKEEKADIVKRGKAIDDQARGLTQRVQALIDPHQGEIDRIDREEADRQRKHENSIDYIRALGRVLFNTPSAKISERLFLAKSADVSSLEEYIKDGKAAQADTILALEQALAIAEAAEKAAVELERLREEDQARKAAEAEAERKREADAPIPPPCVECIPALPYTAAPGPVGPGGAVNQYIGPGSLPPTRHKLIDEIFRAMDGLSRHDVAVALADNNLHRAIKVCY